MRASRASRRPRGAALHGEFETRLPLIPRSCGEKWLPAGPRNGHDRYLAARPSLNLKRLENGSDQAARPD
jgi:hypothetical protein